MNVSEMKETFYKRFGTSRDFLYYTFTGADCTLLGSGDNAINCTLSMGTEIFSRKLGGNMIKFRDINSDRHFDYTFGTPPKIFMGREREIAEVINSLGTNTAGAEILYGTTVPAFAKQKNLFRRALRNALLTTNGKAPEIPKIGYCSCGGKDYPLPLTGYKVITAYCKKGAQTKKDVLRHNESETERILYALDGLNKFNVRPLFFAMNASQSSIEQNRLASADLRLICSIAANTDGVLAARCADDYAVIIVYDDFVDYVVNTLRTDFESRADYSPRFCISKAI